MLSPTDILIPTIRPTIPPFLTPSATPFPVRVLSMPPSSPNWIEILASGLMTSVIILVVTIFIDWLRIRKRYKNLCALIVSEIYNNFHKLIAYKTKEPDKPLEFEISSWENTKQDIIQFVPKKTFVSLAALYHYLRNCGSVSSLTEADILYLTNTMLALDSALRKLCPEYKFEALDASKIAYLYTKKPEKRYKLKIKGV